ncbi:MAG TPA: AMP-binding protein, partial [Stellaceae bacterium]|nr:AMP-binding protein [Stellaceae bacterium]
MSETVFEAFAAAARRWGGRPFVAVLPEVARAYGTAAGELTYREAGCLVADLARRYEHAGYRPGHRVGLLLENRPAFLLHWFSLNRLGACAVPINPDLRTSDLGYLVAHSE